MPERLFGVFAAAVTPLKSDLNPDLDSLPENLAFLASRGCHGALVLGTTGEGPSFSVEERKAVIRAALRVREPHSEFRVLAGTGCASLADAIELTRAAFDLGVDGCVTLPPFYFKGVATEGITESFRQILRQSVPTDGRFFFYHIPRISGVPVPHETIARLSDEFPHAVAGLKDSSADPEAARSFGAAFPDLTIFNGTDSLFSLALEAGASGCITALASLASPLLVRAWEGYVNEKPPAGLEPAGGYVEIQERLTRAKEVLDRYPAPAAIKHLLHVWHGFPLWPVRPPLLPLKREQQAILEAELRAVLA